MIGNLTFDHHLKDKISKANKGIGLIRRLYNFLPCKALVNIYKSYVRPHLDYGDMIYDQPHNDSFIQKIESVLYNAALAITGAIKGTSPERLYQEIGFEPLSDRRWYRRLCSFYKIMKDNAPLYLKSYVPPLRFSYNLERRNLIDCIPAQTDYFNNSFFPFCVNEWNKLDPAIRNLNSISSFKRSLLAVTT